MHARIELVGEYLRCLTNALHDKVRSAIHKTAHQPSPEGDGRGRASLTDPLRPQINICVKAERRAGAR